MKFSVISEKTTYCCIPGNILRHLVNLGFISLSPVCHVLSGVAVPSSQRRADSHQACGQVPLCQTGGVCLLLVRMEGEMESFAAFHFLNHFKLTAQKRFEAIIEALGISDPVLSFVIMTIISTH